MSPDSVRETFHPEPPQMGPGIFYLLLVPQELPLTIWESLRRRFGSNFEHAIANCVAILCLVRSALVFKRALLCVIGDECRKHARSQPLSTLTCFTRA